MIHFQSSQQNTSSFITQRNYLSIYNGDQIYARTGCSFYNGMIP